MIDQRFKLNNAPQAVVAVAAVVVLANIKVGRAGEGAFNLN